MKAQLEEMANAVTSIESPGSNCGPVSESIPSTGETTPSLLSGSVLRVIQTPPGSSTVQAAQGRPDVLHEGDAEIPSIAPRTTLLFREAPKILLRHFWLFETRIPALCLWND